MGSIEAATIVDHDQVFNGVVKMRDVFDHSKTVDIPVIKTIDGYYMVVFEYAQDKIYVQEEDKNTPFFDYLTKIKGLQNGTRDKNVVERANDLIREGHKREFVMRPQTIPESIYPTDIEQEQNPIMIGRSYPRDPQTNNIRGVCYKDIPCELRSEVVQDGLKELDMKAAQPSIILSLAKEYPKKYRFVIDTMKYYKNNKKNLTNKIVENCDVYEWKAKQLFQRITFNGGKNQWLKDFNAKENFPDFVYDYMKAMKYVQTMLSEHPRTKHIFNVAYWNAYITKTKTNDSSQEKNNKALRSATAMVAQSIEREVMTYVIDILKSYDIPIYGYIYDGILVNFGEDKELIKKLRDGIDDAFNLNIDFDIKEAKCDLEVQELYRIIDEYEKVGSFKAHYVLRKKAKSLQTEYMDVGEFILELVKDKFFLENETHNIWYSNKHGFVENKGPISKASSFIETESIEEARTIANDVYKEIRFDYDDFNGDDEDKQKKEKELNSIKCIISTLKNPNKYNAVYKTLKDKLPIKYDVENYLNTEDRYFPFQNGVYDLFDFEFYHKVPEGVYIQKEKCVSYDYKEPNKEQIDWAENFFRDFHDGKTNDEDEIEKQNVFMRMIGMFLLSSSSMDLNKFFVMIGNSGNGKSFCLNQISRVLETGKHFGAISPNSFTISGSSSGHNDDMMSVSDYRLCSISEAGNEDNQYLTLDSSSINRISGNDQISGSRKHEKSKHFTAKSWLVFHCNSIPQFSNPNAALYRRFVPIEFKYNYVPHRTECDTGLQKYVSPENYKAVKQADPILFFHAMLRGLKDVKDRGWELDEDQSSEIRKTKQEKREDMDKIEAWFNRNTVYSQGGKLSKEFIVNCIINSETYVPRYAKDSRGNALVKPIEEQIRKFVNRNNDLEMKKAKVETDNGQSVKISVRGLDIADNGDAIDDRPEDEE